MVSPIFLEFIAKLRWDMVIALLISIIFYLMLIFKRHQKNKELKKSGKDPKDILVVTDFLYSLATSSTLYGGVSAIYYSVSGNLLFKQDLIISEGYIILFSGVVLFALGLLAFKTALKGIKEGKE